MAAMRLPVFLAYVVVKRTLFLPAQLTAGEQYVSLLHQAKSSAP